MIIRRDRNGNKKVTLYKSDTNTLSAAEGLLEDLAANLSGTTQTEAKAAVEYIGRIQKWLEGQESA
jgi:hypothetical protein